MVERDQSLDLQALRAGYTAGRFRPADIVALVRARIVEQGDDGVWVTRLDDDALAAHLGRVDALDPTQAPLYGVPFAIKDNIDLAGVPTTAACPAFAYTPERSAFAVERVLAAGAIPIGKTNLDQFATGLVGVRSPYGVARNPFDAAMLPGGSSSGSAVAVAAGLVSFALGTDTAGSGRVPAAFNNLVGLKPTCGLVSTRGVVPACRSLDCVSVFGLTVDDATAVLDIMAAFDAADPYARPRAAAPPVPSAAFRFGVPRDDQLEFFGHTAAARLFAHAMAQLVALGGTAVPVDLKPFLDAARLLYDGPWIAERYAALGEFVVAHGDDLHPITRTVLLGGATPSAADAFTGQHRLRALRRAVEPVWRAIDVLLTPTVPRAYSIAEVEAEPLQVNARLGYYTNFVNLLDLCGVAVPAGFEPNGFPSGVTLLAPAFHDGVVTALGARLQQALGGSMGGSGRALPPLVSRASSGNALVAIAVCGAHMEGLPLNHQLTSRGARLRTATRTAPCYRMVALPDGRPGLERVEGGASLPLEVWELPVTQLGSLVAGIPPPLGIGTIELIDGEGVSGFLCEGLAARRATDITAFGGWRAYLQTRPSA